MATARSAHLLASAPLGARGRLLTFETPEPLGFVGGQYVIVDTGIEREDGRRHKRAYSLVSTDREQLRFQLAVYQHGPGSHVLHAAEPGAVFSFSGPWGSFLPEDSQPRRTLLIATDSGITAAVGLLRARAFMPHHPMTRLVWLRPDGFDFFPLETLRERTGLVPETGGLPPVGHPERLEALRAEVLPYFASNAPERVYLSGDGAVLAPLRTELHGLGLAEGTVRLESFFNPPVRKAAA
ncbi:FAD-dependent oxidoreductase [Pyxidicoccus fallax]|uniref:FAD-dependent oxidoreductase n=1 Tax=Pyxidicoccus fallax TaxID=394095 RepID=A0A848LGB9_9BACT|nr:FAD-dependent oxidoreductase [Pyxidicoccus fallax]NMO16463.1 FAD-dependent oxidoreductase [Pyxidicoccus fallax]NPC84234.1 FAD-dependent oxidoreductase [Pyxidicoccus fallax]